jgi:dienelactone hydrolase
MFVLANAVRGGAYGQDVRHSELAHPKTHFRLQTYPSQAEWESRRAHLRRQILSAAGLLPMPVRKPLNPRLVRSLRKEGCVVEVILLETMPGYFVGANVFRPVDNASPRPGVLIPHGHWKRGRLENLPSYSVPALAINLARQGYVAISWDMAGYNDTKQTGHSFGGGREILWGFNPLGLQLWNSIRVLDYLISRRDVDASRIACTGASGGGTQTILLTAVDDRVGYSAPVNMISAHYQGADPCEEAPNLRLCTNNVEIAAMMAPRPMLLVSCTGDWTRRTPVEEYPAIRSVYRLYGHEANVQNAHFDADHNYNAATRETVYEFLAGCFGKQGSRSPDVEIAGEIDTREFAARASGGSDLPAGALDYDGLFDAWISESRTQSLAISSRNSLREHLTYALGCEWPSRVNAAKAGHLFFLTRPGRGDRVPGQWIQGEGNPVVLVHPDGSDAALKTDLAAALQSQRKPVLAIDAFQTGRAAANRDRGGRWHLSYNQTDDANRVQDILTALSYVSALSARPPALIGMGDAAIWCTFAAAVAPVRVDLHAELGDFTGTDEDFKKHFFVPCIQRAGGLEAALRVVGGPGRTQAADVSDQNE